MFKSIVKIVLPKSTYPNLTENLKNIKNLKKGFYTRYNDVIAYKKDKHSYTFFFDYNDPNLKCFNLNNIKFYYYDYIPNEKIPDIIF